VVFRALPDRPTASHARRGRPDRAALRAVLDLAGIQLLPVIQPGSSSPKRATLFDHPGSGPTCSWLRSFGSQIRNLRWPPRFALRGLHPCPSSVRVESPDLV